MYLWFIIIGLFALNVFVILKMFTNHGKLYPNNH